MMLRRKFFQLSLGAAPFWLAQKSAAAAETSAASGLSWKEFVEETARAVEALYTDSSPQGQDAYLYRIAANAVKLSEKPTSEMVGMAGAEFYEFGMAHLGRPFFAVHWRMAASRTYPAHNHPDYSVCTLGLGGAVTIENFEAASDAPAFDSGADDYFRLERTALDSIRPGEINTLSATRNNIHRLTSGAGGAEGVDITTAYTKSSAFSFLKFRKASTRRDFAARWVGPNAELAI